MAEAQASPKPDPGDEVHPALRVLFVRVPHVVTGIIFLIACGINIANVVGRYLFSFPIFWAEEVLVFMVVWAVFLSAVAITFNRPVTPLPHPTVQEPV